MHETTLQVITSRQECINLKYKDYVLTYIQHYAPFWHKIATQKKKFQKNITFSRFFHLWKLGRYPIKKLYPCELGPNLIMVDNQIGKLKDATFVERLSQQSFSKCWITQVGVPLLDLKPTI